jgi:hypothetical protein
VIALISEPVSKKAHIWRLPKGWMNAAAGLGDVLHLPLNRQRLQKLTENYVVSNDKVKQALGISSLPSNYRRSSSTCERPHEPIHPKGHFQIQPQRWASHQKLLTTS